MLRKVFMSAKQDMDVIDVVPRNHPRDEPTDSVHLVCRPLTQAKLKTGWTTDQYAENKAIYGEWIDCFGSLVSRIGWH